MRGKLCYEIYQGRSEICPDCPTKKVIETKKAAFSVQPRTQTLPHLEIYAYPIFNEQEEVAAIVEVGRDITERLKIEKILRQSEEKFRTLFESATDALFILTLEGHFIDINRVAYERLGYTKEEMLSMHLSQLDPPEFAARVPERIEQIEKYDHGVFESAHLRKDGTAMPVEINVRTLEFEGKKVLFSIIRDITERKKAPKSLCLHKSIVIPLFAG